MQHELFKVQYAVQRITSVFMEGLIVDKFIFRPRFLSEIEISKIFDQSESHCVAKQA